MRRLFLFLLVAAAGWYAWTQLRPYDPAPWLADLAQLEQATASSYANLDWMVERGVVDPADLHRRTDSVIRHAESDGEARAALREFGRAFKDGHFGVRRPKPEFVGRIERMVRGGGTSDEILASLDGRAACARLGYESDVDESPLALAPGYRAHGEGSFPTGLVQLPGGETAGVLRISSFSESGYPDVCEGVWEEFRSSLTPDSACVDECQWRFQWEVASALLQEEANAVRSLRQAGATILVVDLTNNGGGTDWVDPAARQLVARPISATMSSGVRHPHHIGPLEGDRPPLVNDLARNDLKPGQRELLTAALARLDSAIAEAKSPCDRTGIWQAPVPDECHVLYRPALYSTGLLPWAADSMLEGLESARSLFWPVSYRWEMGAWDGPIVVLVNHRTASASEGFASQLRDAGAAVIVGEQTYGAGCGYTNGGLPIRLEHSGLEVVMPDCARMRTDGTNEVSGVTPDEQVGWESSDNATVIAEKAVAAIGRAVGQMAVRK